MFYQVLIETREAHFVISQKKYKSNTFIIEKNVTFLQSSKLNKLHNLKFLKLMPVNVSLSSRSDRFRIPEYALFDRIEL